MGRAPRNPAGDTGLRGSSSNEPVGVQLTPRRDAPIGILTGAFGARILEPLVATLGRNDIRVIPVPNEFFGGDPLFAEGAGELGGGFEKQGIHTELQNATL